MSPEQQPMVSIITPSLNRRRQLEGAIACVREQSYLQIEHVIVDGGSTDGTLDMLKSFDADHRLRWISEPDDGVYAAVNKGLDLTSGDIVAYLNTDDRYFDYSVEIAVKALVREPTIGFVFGDLLRFYLPEGLGELHFYPPFDWRYVARGNLVSQPTFFLRRAVIEAVGQFDESLKLAADIDYWVRCGQEYRGQKINEVLAIETFHPTRLSSGGQATALAHEELNRIATTHHQEQVGWMRVFADGVRAAFWDRIYRCRFLLSQSVGGYAGWNLFRLTGLRVHRLRVLLSVLPFIGRPYRRDVVRSDAFPWPELIELSNICDPGT